MAVSEAQLQDAMHPSWCGSSVQSFQRVFCSVSLSPCSRLQVIRQSQALLFCSSLSLLSTNCDSKADTPRRWSYHGWVRERERHSPADCAAVLRQKLTLPCVPQAASSPSPAAAARGAFAAGGIAATKQQQQQQIVRQGDQTEEANLTMLTFSPLLFSVPSSASTTIS